MRLPGYGVKNAVVDNHQGFGRVNLDAVLSPAAPTVAQFLEVKPGLKTGQVRIMELTIKSAVAPLHVTLAYTDYPGPTLVNNLNLIVTAPNGKRYVGNQAGTAMTLDVKNNVEVIHVEKPAPGQWKIEIIGSNIPNGPQDCALVCMGHLG